MNANHSDDGVLAEVRSPKIMGDSEGLGVCFRFYLTTVGISFILESDQFFKLWRSAGHPAPPRSVDDGHTRGGEDHDRLEGQRLFLPGVDRGPRSRAHGA